MWSLSRLAVVLSALLVASLAQNSTNLTQRYVILDNDWSSTGFIPMLLALDSDMEVLGITSVTGGSWQPQVTLHAIAILELGNLSCVPVIPGATYPLLMTEDLLQTWMEFNGQLVWQGAFAIENDTAEALGSDPTGGDPNRIVKAAFIEGFPTQQPNTSQIAAMFMVEQVKKYPGQVSIYAAGTMTNVALAVRLDPTFAANAKELVIMGGYVDTTLLQTSGTLLQADVNADINLIMDPEGAKIALTADWPHVTIVGNVANQVYPDAAFFNQTIAINNTYTNFFYDYYGTLFPFWDETAAAIMINPEIVVNSTTVYVTVDTSYASPYYGNIRVFQKALAPPGTRNATYVYTVDADLLKAMIKHSMQYPPTCSGLGY